MAMQDALRLTRNTPTPITALIPVLVECPACGYSKFADSGTAIPCVRCGGTGQVVERWKRYTLAARAVVVEIPQLEVWKGLPPGVEAGDYLVWVSTRDLAVMQECQENADGYVSIFGQHFAIFGLSAEGVMNADEYRAICKKRSPRYIAP